MAKTRHATHASRAYVVDGARTPFLKARGRPGPFSASDLAVAAGRALLARQPIAPDQIDEVILGCAMPSPDESNIGRITALRLGCGNKVPGFTVMRNCASAMQALDSAARNIWLGRADLVLAGGTEAMSRAPVLFNDDMVNWLSDLARAKSPVDKAVQMTRLRPKHFAPVIALIKGLTDPVVGLNMGQTCEVISHRFGISRKEMDKFAARSHQRLAAAFDEGRMDEVVAVYDAAGRAHEEDDGLRRDSTEEKLATLKPFFDRKVGQVTAGNSSQITDGAALLLLASEAAVKKYGLEVLGVIEDCEWAALDPAEMGLGPAHASAPLLQRHGLGRDDIDHWEINEAFAGQVLACLAALDDEDYCRNVLELEGAFGRIDEDKLNIDGGAIAAGHPVGASGARIVLHALKVLERQGGGTAVATLCIGGGQGGAMLLKSKPE
ncbi:acetyl-CoA C-acetyltransferase [Thioalkalivibrio sp. XN279]|uniref:acetyl-CoA C-acetyltransferase n=1 Tax=Thioalkalivibrio sp. XN279 TaxID=2714953 RepID=UPI00140E0892|nr:acetyl-CoA C-acetyltransferase [Thioalkalivibrio sp. XN279]NHA14446.1 acetyl-CoA C-acetyltransferase [Thioalkalivibrio sp. XN279]